MEQDANIEHKTPDNQTEETLRLDSYTLPPLPADGSDDEDEIVAEMLRRRRRF